MRPLHRLFCVRHAEEGPWARRGHLLSVVKLSLVQTIRNSVCCRSEFLRRPLFGLAPVTELLTPPNPSSGRAATDALSCFRTDSTLRRLCAPLSSCYFGLLRSAGRSFAPRRPAHSAAQRAASSVPSQAAARFSAAPVCHPERNEVEREGLISAVELSLVQTIRNSVCCRSPRTYRPAASIYSVRLAHGLRLTAKITGRMVGGRKKMVKFVSRNSGDSPGGGNERTLPGEWNEETIVGIWMK